MATLAASAGVGAEPRGRRHWPDWRSPSRADMVDRLETVVVLVTGREVKAASTPDDRGTVAVAAALDDVERELASR